MPSLTTVTTWAELIHKSL